MFLVRATNRAILPVLWRNPDKDAENVRQRDLSLAFGAVIIKTAFEQVEDTTRNHGGARMKAFAECNGLWFCCTYTERGMVTRIVSVYRVSRKATYK